MDIYQHLFPVGHPPIITADSPRAQQLLFDMEQLAFDTEGWRPIHGTNLEMQLKEHDCIICLSFRRDKIEIYKHVFNPVSELYGKALLLVVDIYLQYRKDFPLFPTYPTWLYTIPITKEPVPEEDTLLMFQITQVMYSMLEVVCNPRDDQSRGCLPKL